MPNYPPVTGIASGNVSATKTKQTGDHGVLISANSPNTDNAFHMRRRRVTGSTVTGSDPNGQTVISWPSNIFDNRNYAIPSPRESLSTLAARILANTNPSRPEVLLPVFLFELRELPGMIAGAGEILLKSKRDLLRRRYLKDPTAQAGALHLSIQFGLAPLVADLKRLVMFTDSVAKRQKEMDRLFSGSGLKRRFDFGSKFNSANLASNGTGAGFAGGVAIPLTGSITSHQWGTVRWKPTPLALTSPLRKGAPGQVRAAILGLRPDQIALNVWEALPFSWLVDWFTNFGDVIQAQSGRLLATPSRPCIMTHDVQTLSHGPIYPCLLVGGAGQGHFCAPGRIRSENKERSVVNLSLSADMPMLSAGQLSILGALVSTRGRLPRGRLPT